MESSTQNSLSGLPDLRQLISKYTKHWFWFVLAIAMAITGAYLYLKYATPKYLTKAQIQIIEEKGSGSELNVFKDLDLLSGSENKVEDEIQILNSRSNFIQVVQELEINKKIMLLGDIRDSELYENPPIYVNFVTPDSIIYDKHFTFFILLSEGSTFGYAEDMEEAKKVYTYGKSINSPLGKIVITPNLEYLARYKGEMLQVIIDPVEKVVEEYKQKISIIPADKVSSIVNISINDPIQQKGIDVINALIRTYNKNGIDDRKAVADRTSEFIEDRISSIYKSLSAVDESEESYKIERGLTDIASEANLNLSVGAATQQELSSTNTELNIAASMKDIVENQNGYELIPSNIGLSDPSITSTTSKYNELVSQRQRLLKSADEKNPIIVNLDQQLDGLKKNMESSLTGMINNLSLQANSLSSQRSKINSRIYSSPANQRALRDITRKQQTTESLYIYLLQKREESQIAFASASPKSKIIDMAYGPSTAPSSPKRKIAYMGAIFLALLVPFSVIFVNSILDNKIRNKADLEKQIGDIPVLGELPKISFKESKSIIKDDRSVLAESLRILRTNLDYIIKPGKVKKNFIFVTSSIPGEGKTFVSSNLASILASTHQKVLLIGADIRNPKIDKFFRGENVDNLDRKKREHVLGLTEYLYDSKLVVNDVLNELLVHTNTIDVIYSGKIPPNPAELLSGPRLKELFDEVSNLYDYIIVDTAPVMLVTDTLLISKYADHTIYVTKAGYTETKLLEFPIKLQKEGKLKGLSFVVNSVKDSNLGYYGGKYGYGYSVSTKKWWKF
tara:strand:- start:2811 stop:5186 length:2376 start_codon:yes stop_codon:yes gene_type:complete